MFDNNNGWVCITIECLITYADKDSDGKISYTEFQAMINPPKPPTEPQPCLPPTPLGKRVTIKTQEHGQVLEGETNQELKVDSK